MPFKTKEHLTAGSTPITAILTLSVETFSEIKRFRRQKFQNDIDIERI